MEHYSDKLNVRQLDLLVDWGFFSVITKPLFKLLLWLTQALGDSGLALLCIAALAKLLTLPLASWSYFRLAERLAMRQSPPVMNDGIDDAKIRRRTWYDKMARRLAV
jgi:YidC/Oxa1 family membrane protein insertase